MRGVWVEVTKGNWGMGITIDHDELGGRMITNAVGSCGGWDWLQPVNGVVGESGSGARSAALTARLRCQGWKLRAYKSCTCINNGCVIPWWVVMFVECLNSSSWGTLFYACLGLLLLMWSRWAPRALEGGPSERQYLLGIGREDSEWGLCCRWRCSLPSRS